MFDMGFDCTSESPDHFEKTIFMLRSVTSTCDRFQTLQQP